MVRQERKWAGRALREFRLAQQEIEPARRMVRLGWRRFLLTARPGAPALTEVRRAARYERSDRLLREVSLDRFSKQVAEPPSDASARWAVRRALIDPSSCGRGRR